MRSLSTLLTAMSGLTAQSYAFETISGNIANAQTIGFRQVEVNFAELVTQRPPHRETAGAVLAFSQLSGPIGGATRTTGVATNMALNGSGYFAVQARTGSTGAQTSAGETVYTRRGDFAVDADGHLVNGAGYSLIGRTSDRTDAPIRIPTTPNPPGRTGTVTYRGNLPAYPKTQDADPAVAGSEHLDPSLAAGPTIPAQDGDAFDRQSISGGDTTVFDPAGGAVALGLRWAKTASAGGGGQDSWALYVESDAEASGSAPRWTKLTDASFTPDGRLTSANAVSIPSLVVNGTTIGPITLDFGSGGLTQYANPAGEISGIDIAQDGYGSSSLASLSVASDGTITGTYQNAKVATLGRVLVAQFGAEGGLKRLTGGIYGQTISSGPPSFGLDGSTLIGGAIEQSNTDIAGEFSKMIVTQQAYSANTRVMSTVQTMVEDVIDVIR